MVRTISFSHVLVFVAVLFSVGVVFSLTHWGMPPDLRQWLEEYKPLIDLAATVTIAAFTAALYFATYRLWRGSDDQLKHSMASDERTSRAYIFISQVSTSGVSATSPFTATIPFKNFGKTPASDVRVNTGVACGAADNPTLPELKFRPNMSASCLAPGASFSLSLHHPSGAPQEDIDMIVDGESCLYVYGYIDYLDVFMKRRRTSFRLKRAHQLSDPIFDVSSPIICDVGNEYT